MAAFRARVITDLDEVPVAFRSASRRQLVVSAVSARRHVVVLPEFFDRLDDLLPAERTADGTPSTADFVLHELTSIVETLAEDYEGVTTPIPGRRTG